MIELYFTDKKRTLDIKLHYIVYVRLLSWESCKVLSDKSLFDSSRLVRSFATWRSMSDFSLNTKQ